MYGVVTDSLGGAWKKAAGYLDVPIEKHCKASLPPDQTKKEVQNMARILGGLATPPGTYKIISNPLYNPLKSTQSRGQEEKTKNSHCKPH